MTCLSRVSHPGFCRWLLAVSAVSLPIGVGAQSGPGLPAGPAADAVNWQQVEQNHRTRLVEPTAPVPVDRLLLPWDATKAVVLVLPLSQWREQPGVHRILQDLLAALLPHVSVIALYHELDERLLGDWLLAMEADPQLAPLLGRIEFLGCQTFSIWARDFSPIFARSKDGRLLAIDPSFLPTHRLLDLMQSAAAEIDPVRRREAMHAATVELRGMRGADAVPAALTAWLESRWHVSTTLSRPPVYLLGGDFLPVDARNALVSALTLAENGGRAEALQGTLRDYAGVERVVFLENLPGDTIEHLDFIVQPIAPGVILAAAPPEKWGEDRAFHRHLHTELAGRLQRNRELLQRRFPNHRIIAVPMPPPLVDSDDAVVDELFLHCAQAAAARRGLPFQPPAGNEDPLDPLTSDPRLAEALRTELGIREWRSPVVRRRAVENFLGRPIAELIARHVEEQVRYRSYVNSLYVRTAAGVELVLVPRYRPATPEETDLLARLEQEVEAAYREALPKARLQWIDCTELTGLLGAIHCLAATVPDLDAIAR